MTRKNRYKELCTAYDNGVESCDQYRRECREFVQDLRSAIIEYLQCPDTKVFLFQPTRGFVFKSHVLQGDAFDTEFAENGTALIGFAINANDKELEDKFFTFIVLFKKKGEDFYFSLLDDAEDYTTKDDGIIDFCEHVFNVSVKSLNERLSFFLQSPEEEVAPIGFKIQQQKEAKKV
jgi:hypothetical protein